MTQEETDDYRRKFAASKDLLKELKAAWIVEKEELKKENKFVEEAREAIREANEYADNPEAFKAASAASSVKKLKEDNQSVPEAKKQREEREEGFRLKREREEAEKKKKEEEEKTKQAE